MEDKTKNTSLNKEQIERKETFQRATKDMIATNDRAYLGDWSDRFKDMKNRDFSVEEIYRIINGGNLTLQRRLSNSYFNKGGFYTRILTYYATLYKYIGILIPNTSFGKDLSTEFIQKRYYNAMNFVEKISIPTMLQNFALKALKEGCYFGVIQTLDKDNFTVLDLPSEYCSSRFKDKAGNDLIEFDTRFFDHIRNADIKKTTLQVYPNVITNYYNRWKKGLVRSPWVNVPSEIGICFPLYDGRPFFLSTIPAIINYEDSIDVEKERDIEEIKKIIVQHVPHNSDGTLVFEPDEAQVMHDGAVNMLKKNENVSILTTYADVDAIVSKTGEARASDTVEKMLSNIFSEASVSDQLFTAKSNLTLDKSINNDIALMSQLINKFNTFITNLINRLYANSNISFKYSILPITFYNQKEYIEDAFKLASSGYSFIMPALAMGISQRDLGSIKDLENNVLGLRDKLMPLQSSYTQSYRSGEKTGRPEVSNEEKSEQTIKNKVSLENQGQK